VHGTQRYIVRNNNNDNNETKKKLVFDFFVFRFCFRPARTQVSLKIVSSRYVIFVVPRAPVYCNTHAICAAPTTAVVMLLTIRNNPRTRLIALLERNRVETTLYFPANGVTTDVTEIHIK